MQPQEGAGGYGFAAYPRVVQSKPKFKDPYSAKEQYSHASFSWIEI